MKRKEIDMTLYQKFKKLDLDPAVIGLMHSETAYPYFCTPKGARIIGWAGVDGIHYCFVPGFGEMVFAVNPTNSGACVHPIAGSFEDMLRLLVACGSMDALEQAHDFDAFFFDAYCRQNPPGAEQEAAFTLLREKLGITPMEDPYTYLRQLQQEFDYGRIPYRAEYYDMDMNPTAEPEKPAWKVTYDGGFSPRRGYAGKEIPLADAKFLWGDAQWHAPAVYVCSKGMVVDLCMDVDPKKIAAFMEKWDLLHEDEHTYSDDEQEQIFREHPLNLDFRSMLTVNGKELRSEHGCGCTWIVPSCLPEGFKADHNAKEILEHYDLDPSRCWAIHRVSYGWTASRKPEIRSVRLHLEQDPVNLPGLRFRTPAVGESVSFVHPVFGTEHTLTVQEYENAEITSQSFQDESMEYPTHYAAMTYTLSPDLSGRHFMLQDCDRGDTPRYKTGDQASTSAASIGIIGGADGPTAVFLAPVSSEARPELHTACSALHFEPVETVEWKMIFREKNIPDTDIDLL